jgi:hypothetical protein
MSCVSLSRSEVAAACKELTALIEHDAPERGFQRLFSERPFILSRTLPLRPEPTIVVPLGRPGRSEPDFALHPQGSNVLGIYGLVEIKRPSTLVVVEQRKGILSLSKDAATAVDQLRTYARDMAHPPVVGDGRLVLLGNREHLFIIAGLTADLARRVRSELLTDGLIPGNCELVPYDVLLNRLEATTPRLRMHVLAADAVAVFYSQWDSSQFDRSTLEGHSNRRYAAAWVDDLSKPDQERLYALEPWLRWAVDDLYV